MTTFDDRANSLAAAYSLTARQARFLTLTALISGHCLRRQYATYAGIRLGKNVASFLDDLVQRRVATKSRPRLHRSYVYHLRHRRLYETIAAGNIRHRRPATRPGQARRIMLLDFALTLPEATWHATEHDKTRLFQVRGLPDSALPGRVYQGSTSTTLRHFVAKFPIYTSPQNSTVHFVYLSLDTSGQGLLTFLAEHATLLHALPSWHVAVVYPAYLSAARPTWEAATERSHFSRPPTLTNAEALDLHAYFRVQHALTRTLESVPVRIDHEYERRRRRFQGSAYAALYEHWCRVGGPALPSDKPPDYATWRPVGDVSYHELPHSYDLFGSFPGVA